MSLITRCPACRTMFKVVADQLRISDGWVRCGKCEEIFDASAHMVQADIAARVPAANDHPDTVPFERGPAAAMAFESAAPATAPASETRTSEPPPLTQGRVDFEPQEPQPADVVPVLEPVGPGSGVLPDGSAYGVAPADRPPTTDFVPEATAPALGPDPAALAAELSFMRNAKKNSRWHRPLVRAFLLVACLLLVTGPGLAVAGAGARPHCRHRAWPQAAGG